MKLNVALIPDNESGAVLERYSQQLGQQLPSRYVLGRDSVPHCTVLQFEWDENAIEAWEHLQPLHGTELALHCIGTYCEQSQKGESWLGVRVEKTSDLAALQKKVVDLLSVDKAMIHNGTGEKYRPHFTTGMVQGEIEAVHMPPPALKAVTCKLRLGLTGEHWTLKELLF